jgi:ABC-type microcin C transport system duplicated ATPase subunit YejF
VTEASQTLLKVSGLQTWYPIQQGLMRRTTGWIQAATDVSFEIGPGETLALVGESGCGKSTVGRSVLGLESPQQGEVLFEGRDLLGLSAEDLRAARQRLQIIFQDPMASLDPRMRIRDQIVEGMQSFGIGKDERERTERAAALLERVQLDPLALDRYPHEFSGGQRHSTYRSRHRS